MAGASFILHHLQTENKLEAKRRNDDFRRNIVVVLVGLLSICRVLPTPPILNCSIKLTVSPDVVERGETEKY